ncbi:hypothetical protein EVAR_10781_1 [Eumeta japonica]|uniref:Uncharacterized protein n=1 Tax=Eumeta variegata TaxID=151549 RepID=A0A4C1W725_EUMVA|nr:hypothetical protein EVAR_10781_1 [Eumeta japonica]
MRADKVSRRLSAGAPAAVVSALRARFCANVACMCPRAHRSRSPSAPGTDCDAHTQVNEWSPRMIAKVAICSCAGGRSTNKYSGLRSMLVQSYNDNRALRFNCIEFMF